MIVASELRVGTVIKLDSELFHAVSVEYHAGTAKLGSAVFVKLKSLRTQHFKELRFHPDDKIEDVELERREMEYLYTDGTGFYFMNPETFDQVSLPKETVGRHEKFLRPNMRIPVELYEGAPVKVVFPEAVELAVVSAPPGLKEHEAVPHKTVVLENGMEVLAPQFIKEGDVVRIEVASGKYLARVKREGRRP